MCNFFLLQVKRLQITDGLPRVVNLSGIFDRATKLQSIVIKAFNIKLVSGMYINMTILQISFPVQ